MLRRMAETGTISLATHGALTRDLDREGLARSLEDLYVTEKEPATMVADEKTAQEMGGAE